MQRFFKSTTKKTLYKHLQEAAVGSQVIREPDVLDRLLAAKEGSEVDAQKEKRDVIERIHGFDVDLEFEKKFATDGQVIAPLTEEFKDELTTFTFN